MKGSHDLKSPLQWDIFLFSDKQGAQPIFLMEHEMNKMPMQRLKNNAIVIYFSINIEKLIMYKFKILKVILKRHPI